ncbi:MAG: peptidoglycan DD-metalloendopeptidase family protein [Henriciella sp.]|uniref:peptidoglycan DD-metalloendopeptidase family protein n=1 Tax=Henriciella sp. TaxID=1968823 RepID=UPI003C770230
MPAPDLSAKRTAYDAWLAARTGRPAETVPGLSEALPFPLDPEGLARRGWSDLPLYWIPEPGIVYADGYGEDRAIYDTPIFNPEGVEPRTIHLGLDVFALPGTRVHAPLDGVMHSFQRNDNEKDYGPTIILEHEVTPELTFYTLYGHLSLDSLDGLEPRKPVSKGQEIARLGSNDVNGGWAPHLHFQVILDVSDKHGDFPGVCRKSEQEAWLTLCPDPEAFLGLGQRR